MRNETHAPILAFRTHLWDAHIEVLARRLAASCQRARFIVLVDETGCRLEVSGFEKLSHDNDFSDLGLLSYPPPSILWYGGDYPLYRLRQKFPEAPAYAMVEFDVSATADLSGIFDAIAAESIDLIAHDIHDVGPEWGFYHSVAPHFSAPAQAMIHAVFVSSRAIDHMLQRRRDIATRIIDGDIPVETWPFCEGLVPSAIRELPNAKLEELSRFVRLPYYIYGTPLHIADPLASTPESIIHPVLSGSRFIAKRMEFDNPADIFDPASSLTRQLRYCLASEFIDPLIECFKRKQPSYLGQFLHFAATRGWLHHARPINLALNQPADQSSISSHSRFPETARDASGGNDGNKGGGYGFWTAVEQDPHWQVDLGNLCRIDRIVLFNFLGARHECASLALLTSDEGTNWMLAATKLDNHPFGGADGHPHSIDFPTPIQSRFVRVQLIGHGSLHLDEIEVFGIPTIDARAL